MATIKFTASIVRKEKGCYLAHAHELSIKAEQATTQRGALKNLNSPFSGSSSKRKTMVRSGLSSMKPVTPAS